MKHNRKSVLLSRRPPGPVPLSKRALSVIIPVRDSLPELHQCLQALSSNQEPLTELIVVDDCSSADVAEVAAQYGARYFRLPLHQGPAAARNLGAQHAAGEIIIFIDADVMVAPNTLTIIREKFDSNPDLDALFGSYDDSPQHTDFCSSYKNLLHHYTHQHSEEEATTFWSGCGAIRKKAFEDVKGFDEGTYPVASIEDIDLGLRLCQKGLKIQLVKGLQVKHLKKVDAWIAGTNRHFSTCGSLDKAHREVRLSSTRSESLLGIETQHISCSGLDFVAGGNTSGDDSRSSRFRLVSLWSLQLSLPRS